MNDKTQFRPPVFRLTRMFNTHVERVWAAWTERELLSQWYGPGVDTVVHRLDVRPGGRWLNEMRWKDGGSFERITYLEVERPNLLVWEHAATDSEWNVIANPMMPDWPRLLTGRLVLTSSGENRTALEFTWEPREASKAEAATFARSLEMLQQPWGKGMDALESALS